MNPLSKLQSEAVKEFKDFYDADGTLHIGGERLIKLETFIQDQIEKAYSKGREEVIDCKMSLSGKHKWSEYFDGYEKTEVTENGTIVMTPKNILKCKYCGIYNDLKSSIQSKEK
jgi:hypothetical protein